MIIYSLFFILKNLPFYAEVNGKFIPSTCDETGRKYQISWSENHKTASAGEIKLRIFDEDGFFNYKKAQRNNEDLSKIKEVHNISFEHQVLINWIYKLHLNKNTLIFSIF